MAARLTEKEVHLACAEIASQGERPTSLNLLDKLGRGSLTTITKYLNSWNVSDDAQAIEAESLPAVVQLPPELSKDGEDLLKKMWNVAKNITDKELEVQREALKQAERTNQSKVEEAFKFSEAQSMKIERMEEEFTSIKNQLDEKHKEYKKAADALNEADKANVGLTKDNEQLKQVIDGLNQKVEELKKDNEAAVLSKGDLKQLHALDMETKDEQIKKLERITSRFEFEQARLREEAEELKVNLRNANQAARNADKQVAKLEGKLEVYNSLDIKSLKKDS